MGEIHKAHKPSYPHILVFILATPRLLFVRGSIISYVGEIHQAHKPSLPQIVVCILTVPRCFFFVRWSMFS